MYWNGALLLDDEDEAQKKATEDTDEIGHSDVVHRFVTILFIRSIVVSTIKQHRSLHVSLDQINNSITVLNLYVLQQSQINEMLHNGTKSRNISLENISSKFLTNQLTWVFLGYTVLYLREHLIFSNLRNCSAYHVITVGSISQIKLIFPIFYFFPTISHNPLLTLLYICVIISIIVNGYLWQMHIRQEPENWAVRVLTVPWMRSTNSVAPVCTDPWTWSVCLMYCWVQFTACRVIL